MKKVLIVWGGWEGHVPEQMAKLFEEMLLAENFDVEVTNDYTVFADTDNLKQLDLIVPCITMDKTEDAYIENVSQAVMAGTGLAGCHGGMGDSFRENTTWQFMVGGQFVAHPGDAGNEYRVNIKNSSSPLTEGLEDFTVTTEQYYMHVDPAIEVLATTRFPTADGPHVPNGAFEMPVAWTKHWGEGRVYYNALGHVPANLESGTTAREMVRRGLLWAANA
ncbi:hypothetical protein PDESU_04473 [Pontiella desulfatans]|uniref:ThuA-like domain-containing protein n=1 Tax=Pontiella desulfatans TaxID=2750659 RepID=A0A6C2U7I6_PONDE|nr:ThuA domain-containing protein [Pontiella desulfatans]VGO15885.1 hypothetical protein PDESU_04473 [Pontiella desulfatans]